MKKILLVAAIASTFMAFAQESETPTEGGTANATEVQQIGITAITTLRQSVIVAFSYEGVTADKLVKTTNLTVGDELIAYKDTEYMSWILAEKEVEGVSVKVKYWMPYKDGNGNNLPEATTLNQAVGTGIWLRRATTPTEEYTFYVYGTPATSKTITVAAGKTMLIGNPNSTPRSPTIAKAAAGDAIYIPNGSAFTKYTYGSNGSWNKGFTALNNPPTFDANTGAWYESKGTENVTIEW